MMQHFHIQMTFGRNTELGLPFEDKAQALLAMRDINRMEETDWGCHEPRKVVACWKEDCQK